MSAAARCRASDPSRGPAKRNALAQRAAQRRARAPRGATTRSPATRASWASRRSARRKSRSGGALLLGAEERSRSGPRLARSIGAAAVGPRARPPRSRRGRSGAAGRAWRRSSPSRASRRPKKSSTKRRAICVGEHALGRRVEGADVQRPRVAQRDARRARGERLVDVDEVERREREQVLDRARDVERHRAGDPPPRVEPRPSTSPDAQHADAALPARRAPPAGRARRGCAGASRARGRGRLRRRDDQHAVAARAQLVGDALHPRVDLVVRLPGDTASPGRREAL